jgi:hypothetical protein
LKRDPATHFLRGDWLKGRLVNVEALTVVTTSSMRGRSILAAILLTAAITGCTQPGPGSGDASEAPSVAPSSANEPEASATPYTAPGY